MTGDLDPGTSASATWSAAGVRISSTSVLNLTLKDNAIHVDVSSNTATLHHFAIVAPSTAFSWGTGGSDNNDYYVNPANAQMVLGGIGTTIPYTDVTTLAAWRTQFTPNQDAASIAADPIFVSTSDVHVNNSGAAVSPLANAGVSIAGVTNDFDNDTRTATPDIGADEFLTYNLFLTIVGNGSVTKNPDYPTYNPGQTVQLTAVPNQGNYFVGWSGDASGNTNPLDVVMDSDKHITATFDVSSDAEEVPAVTFMDHNFPNPFSEATTIRFGIAHDSPVRTGPVRCERTPGEERDELLRAQGLQEGGLGRPGRHRASRGFRDLLHAVERGSPRLQAGDQADALTGRMSGGDGSSNPDRSLRILGGPAQISQT